MCLKILHTSDWHLGKTFKETTFDLLQIQKQILEEIIEVVEEERPDIVLIAGDIFDNYNPPFEAEKVFYETLIKLSKHNCFIIVTAGNHDSPEKLQISKPLIMGKHPIFIMTNPFDNFSSLIFENDMFYIGFEKLFLKIKLKEKNKVVAIKVLPYLSEVRLGLSGEEFLNKINEILSEEPQFSCDNFLLMSHIYVSGAQKSGSERILQIGGIEYISSEYLPKRADYIALGHLHRYQKIKNAVYSGSIYPFDLAEIEHKKGICLWRENQVEFIEFKKMPQIKKLEFETIEDAINNVPEDKNLYYIVIKTPQSYTPTSIEKLLKAYKDKLINWQFSLTEKIQEPEIPDISSLNDAELFREFYKAKLNREPSEDTLKVFLETLEEVKNATY
ncbi:MAG: exonuclease subunit SbcD [Thermodesulfovibrionaceae bacterium]